MGRSGGQRICNRHRQDRSARRGGSGSAVAGAGVSGQGVGGVAAADSDFRRPVRGGLLPPARTMAAFSEVTAVGCRGNCDRLFHPEKD